MVKRIFTLILLLVVFVTSLPVAGFATEIIANKLENDPRYNLVYYSDLFYTYDESYLKSKLLADYVRETYNVTDKVYNEYCDSFEGFWTTIKTSLNAATNLKEYFKLMSSCNGGQDFTYERALDKANTVLFTALAGDYPGGIVNCGSIAVAYEKRFSAFAKALNELRKDGENLEILERADWEEGTNLFQKLLTDGGIFFNMDDAKINGIMTKIAKNAADYGWVFDALGGYYNFMVSVSISMIMEDVRLETLNYVIDHVEEGSTAYDGFTRLRRQLTDGFENYFVNTYLIQNGAVELVYDGIFKAFTNYMGGMGSAYTLVASATRIVSAIIFDVIFNVPDLDDIMLQHTLCAYASDLYDSILSPYSGAYLTEFDSNFSTDSIKRFEDVFNMYICATNEAFKASEDLTHKKNRDEFNEIKNKYASFSYDIYTSDIKETIMAEDIKDRKFKRFNEFYLNDGMKFMHRPSDIIEDGYFYTQYGTVWADVRVSGTVNFIEGECLCIDGTFNVEKGATLNLSGNLTANSVGTYGNINITETGVFDINGNLGAGCSTYPYTSAAAINNSGQLNVRGNITLARLSHQSTYWYAVLKMNNPNAVLRISGDFIADDYENCKISDGTTIFDGNNGVQNISNLTVKNMEVTNPDGVYFTSTLMLSGNIDLHSTPSDGAGIQVSSGATFAEGSDYRVVGVPRGVDYTLINKVDADFNILGTLRVPKDTDAAIYGNVALNFSTYPYRTSGYLYVDGVLEVSGNINLVKVSYQSQYWYSYIVMSDPQSVMYLGGDFNAGGTDCCKLTDGKIVFNGSRLQQVSNIICSDIEVLNPYGIKYITAATVNGVYDLNANPLDNNGYSTTVSKTTVISPGSDYKTIVVPENNTFYAEGDIKADISVSGLLLVQDGKSACIDGDVKVNVARYSTGKVTINGDLEVTGDMTMMRSGSDYTEFRLSDAGELTIGGDFIANGSTNIKQFDGSVTFNGTEAQSASYVTAPKIVLKNHSSEGVSFTTGITPKTLFDHNNLTYSGWGSFNDYDGDGVKDNEDPDPKTGADTVPEISSDGYTVTVTAASEIAHIRYAPGYYTTSNDIRNAPGRVDVDAKTVKANTVYGEYIAEMADGGVYSFWIKMNNGNIYIYQADLSVMQPTVNTNGVKLTVGKLYGVKDVFIAKGKHDTYADVKANNVVLLTQNKIDNAHSYTYTLPDYGEYTVLVRYTDTSRENTFLYTKLRVLEPVFSLDGLQLTVGNLNDVKVIRVAYGDYNTSGEIKRAQGCRNYTGKADIKDADDYRIQFRDNGYVSVAVEYNNGYVKIYKCNIQQKTPTANQSENTVTFGDLDGLAMIRYVQGEYHTSAEIKRAKGSKVLKPDSIVDGLISVTLDPGTYSFCVQYKDESYNYYIFTVE